MSWLDMVIIVLLAVPVFIGVKSGIVKLLFMVVGVILGVVLAGRLSDKLAGMLGFISDERIAKVIAFAVILIVLMAVAAILAKVVHWALSKVLLGWIDHLVGGILGLALGFFFCGAILTMWVKFLGISTPVENSFLAGIMLKSFPVVLGLLPSEFH